MQGSSLVAQSLERAGINLIFGIVGVPVTPIVEAAQKLGIRFIGFRNEQAASYGASVVGYLQPGHTACCITVAGPGFVHALAGVVNAKENGWPLLLLSAGCDTSLVSKGAFQELNQIDGVKPYAKHAVRVEAVHLIPQHIEEAVRIAIAGHPGPVYVEIPSNLINCVVPTENVKFPERPPHAPVPSQPPHSELEAAVRLLRSAKKPLAIIGKGAAYAMAEKQLAEFIGLLRLPFVTSPMGKGVLPDDHPCSVAAARSLALREADIVLVIGARLNWMFGFGSPPVFSPHVKFIQVEIGPEQLHANAKVELALLGDARSIIAGLFDIARAAPFNFADICPDWWRELTEKESESPDKANRELVRKQCEDVSLPLSYHAVLSAIAAHLPRDAIIVNEGANTMDFGRLLLPNYYPRSRLDAGTLGAMGVGLGYAIAAAVSHPERRTIAVQGDSAFGFSGLELETVCREKLPIVFIILNNNGIYAGLKELPASGPIPPTALLPNARYEKIAEAFGGKGYFVTTVEELHAAMRAALAEHIPSLINVMIRTDGPVPKIVQQQKH